MVCKKANNLVTNMFNYNDLYSYECVDRQYEESYEYTGLKITDFYSDDNDDYYYNNSNKNINILSSKINTNINNGFKHSGSGYYLYKDDYESYKDSYKSYIDEYSIYRNNTLREKDECKYIGFTFTLNGDKNYCNSMCDDDIINFVTLNRFNYLFKYEYNFYRYEYNFLYIKNSSFYELVNKIEMISSVCRNKITGILLEYLTCYLDEMCNIQMTNVWIQANGLTTKQTEYHIYKNLTLILKVFDNVIKKIDYMLYFYFLSKKTKLYNDNILLIVSFLHIEADNNIDSNLLALF
jgi:hypothetical protein